jgi:hypothetical protein
VEPDAEPGRARTSGPARRRRVRRALRRVGLSFQLLLCASLAVWAVVTGVVVFAGVAVVLLVAATVLLIREFRGSEHPGLPAGADLGEGAADDDPGETEHGQ